MLEVLPIVVYSPLRWDSGFHRPHGLVARLARERQVLFVEEPMPAEEGVPDSWDLQFPHPRLVICRPVLEGAGYGFDGVAPEKLAELTAQLLRWQDVGDHLAWLYTPLAQPVAQALEPALTIYDYLDERCPILGAPRDLHGQREAERLRAADVAAFATAAGAHSSSESCARLRVGGP